MRVSRSFACMCEDMHFEPGMRTLNVCVLVSLSICVLVRVNVGTILGTSKLVHASVCLCIYAQQGWGLKPRTPTGDGVGARIQSAPTKG